MGPFRAPVDGIQLSRAHLAEPTLLGDEGLSAHLLAQLDELEAQTSERSLSAAVHSAVADALPDGQPSRSQVARRLGMSERTPHRRPAEHGESFQTLVARARRDAAESLLRAGTTTWPTSPS
jgi:AraC-like DNA-binding protein